MQIPEALRLAVVLADQFCTLADVHTSMTSQQEKTGFEGAITVPNSGTIPQATALSQCHDALQDLEHQLDISSLQQEGAGDLDSFGAMSALSKPPFDFLG